MRAAIDEDDVEDIESSRDHRATAEQLVEWAGSPHPEDEVSTRELLARAGEQLEFAGDEDGALALYRRALATEGEAILDPRAHLVPLLLRRGEREDALELDRELRRSNPSGSANYDFMGDVWQEDGDTRRALGWFTRGLLRHEQGPPFGETELALLCLSRWHLRERLGHAPDDYDLIGIGLQRQWKVERTASGHPAADAAVD